MAANPSIASHPFNNTITTDLVLRTPDAVDFYVHKCILSIVSPFFEQMFTLDQSSSHTTDRQSVIDVSERSTTLDALLRLCYPVFEPDIPTPSFAVKVIAAAQKYDMQPIVSRLKVPLRAFIAHTPLVVFAISCNHQLDDVAWEAALAWGQLASCRRHPQRSPSPSPRSSPAPNYPLTIDYYDVWQATPAGEAYTTEMAGVSSGAYSRLVRYLMTGIDPPSYTTPPLALDHDRHEVLCPMDYYGSPHLRLGIHSDTIVASIDGTRFPAHRLILCAASQVLKDLLTDAEQQQLEVVSLPENGCVLAILLRSCYPAGAPLEEDLPLSDLESVIGAASKYELPVLEESAKRVLEKRICSEPLEVYYRSVRVGWMEGATAAALQLSRLPNPESDLYIPLMETMPARYHHALLKFCFDYRKAAVKCFPYLLDRNTGSFRDHLWEKWMWSDDARKSYPELFIGYTILTTFNDPMKYGQKQAEGYNKEMKTLLGELNQVSTCTYSLVFAFLRTGIGTT